MQVLLDSRAKTVPSNYNVKGYSSDIPGSETPGYSLTAAAWDKAKRQEDPNYDWNGYQNSISNPLFDHPAFVGVEHDPNTDWEAILRELEPFNRRAV